MQCVSSKYISSYTITDANDSLYIMQEVFEGKFTIDETVEEMIHFELTRCVPVLIDEHLEYCVMVITSIMLNLLFDDSHRTVCKPYTVCHIQSVRRR